MPARHYEVSQEDAIELEDSHTDSDTLVGDYMSDAEVTTTTTTTTPNTGATTR